MKELTTQASEVFRAARLPAVLLAFIMLFLALDYMVDLPRPNQVLAFSETYINGRYGYLVVFAAAFLETIPPANFYLPGSAVVFLAVAAARQNPFHAIAILGVVVLAFFLAYLLNFAVGRFGWSWILVRCGLGPTLERWQSRIANRGPKLIWWAYVHPNIGAIAAMSCGVMRVPFWRFVVHSVGATAFWVVFWGFIAYFFGVAVLEAIDVRWLIPLILTWLALAITMKLRKNAVIKDR